jgi:hypothetical protein
MYEHIKIIAEMELEEDDNSSVATEVMVDLMEDIQYSPPTPRLGIPKLFKNVYITTKIFHMLPYKVEYELGSLPVYIMYLGGQKYESDYKDELFDGQHEIDALLQSPELHFTVAGAIQIFMTDFNKDFMTKGRKKTLSRIRDEGTTLNATDSGYDRGRRCVHEMRAVVNKWISVRWDSFMLYLQCLSRLVPRGMNIATEYLEYWIKKFHPVTQKIDMIPPQFQRLVAYIRELRVFPFYVAGGYNDSYIDRDSQYMRSNR